MVGSSLDDWLEAEGLKDRTDAAALLRVRDWQDAEIARLRAENEKLRALLRDTLAREAALEGKLPRQDTEAARERRERMTRILAGHMR